MVNRFMTPEEDATLPENERQFVQELREFLMTKTREHNIDIVAMTAHLADAVCGSLWALKEAGEAEDDEAEDGAHVH